MKNDLQPNISFQEEPERVSEPGGPVRGVYLRPAPPRAHKVKPLAALLVVLVVLGMVVFMATASKHHSAVKTQQEEGPRLGNGPATTQEKTFLQEAEQKGLNIGESHLQKDFVPRPSLAASLPSSPSEVKPKDGYVSIAPRVEYTSAGVNQTPERLSAEQQQRVKQYELEQQAMQSSTAVHETAGAESTARPQANPLQDSIDRLRAAAAAASSAPGSLGEILNAVRSNGATPPVAATRDDYVSQNAQDEKEVFQRTAGIRGEQDYLKSIRTSAVSKYEIQSGWLISAVLEQEVNSDLPGLIRAMVRENVYDSVTGNFLLIPAGSRLIGVYSSHVSYRQGGLQAIWSRIIFPDGSSIDLGGMEGDAQNGASGFRDQVNNHWGKLISGALLTSLFAAGVEVSQRQNQSALTNPTVGQTASAALGQQVGQLGIEVTRRNLSIQPTVRIRPGYRFFVRVEKDIIFATPYTTVLAKE